MLLLRPNQLNKNHGRIISAPTCSFGKRAVGGFVGADIIRPFSSTTIVINLTLKNIKKLAGQGARSLRGPGAAPLAGVGRAHGFKVFNLAV